MSFFTEVNRNSKRRQAWTANFSAPFQHWHWTLPPERRFIFTNENTPWVSPIENWSKGATIPWKRLRIIQICREHYGNRFIKANKVHANPSNKKETDKPTAFRRKTLRRLLKYEPRIFWARITENKNVHAHPPRKKLTAYATGQLQKVSCQLLKCDLRTLWPLVTPNKSNSIATDVMKKDEIFCGLE